MIHHLSGYRFGKDVYQSSLSHICRGFEISRNKPVIIKILNKEFPNADDLARFKREYRLVSALNGDGIILTHGMEKYGNSLALIFEDFGGDSLAANLKIYRPDFETKLDLAIRIVDALGQIHQQSIIHKDINPSNIIWHPQTNQIKIIDFGISTELSRETPEPCNPNILEGTLAYISPEQTGRMNRAMDSRTDLYSLGITLYEMFTGKPPFQASDAMGLIHCHIAVVPLSPHDQDSNIPKPLSQIIMKLISKIPEDRYQSTTGVKRDLEICLAHWEKEDHVPFFEIGGHDVSSQFQIPQKLYGRDKHIERMLNSFDRVSRGQKEIMLVAGYSGVGKSSLVHEINKPIVGKRGHFISGKFDQFKRNIPYSALIHAFQKLVKNLLAEDEIRLEYWRNRLLKFLGPSGQVVIDVIPEVELIIGRQPPVQVLDPDQSKNRFNLVFQNFVRVFAQKECPLVIFIDDLQWADLPSLQLIKEFMSDIGTSYLFIIGAYRDNEIQATHPLIKTTEELKQNGVTVNTITLEPLTLFHVNQLVSDVLLCDSNESLPLSNLCHEKTLGNPFFLYQLMYSLYDEGYIQFDPVKGGWHFDQSQIRKVDIRENVVDLMVGKIKKLPEETQKILTLASCIGNQFDLETIELVGHLSKMDAARILFDSLKERLVVPIDDTYKYILEGQENLNVSYGFVHDRIQQAAYSLIAEEHKKETHLRIGRILAENMDGDEPGEKIFDVVNHLNQGIELICEQEEVINLARLNLLAGQKAIHSAAYIPACDYLEAGMGLMGEKGWETNYHLTLSLYNEAVESFYLSVNYPESEALFKAIIAHAQNAQDMVRAYEIRILTLISESNFKDAMDTGLVILRMLDVKFPKYPNKLHIILGLIKTKIALKGKNDRFFLEASPMSDPLALARASILHKMASTTLFSRPELYPLTIFRRLLLSLVYGEEPMFSFSSYGSFGLILCSIGAIDEGYRFGTLAGKILNASPVKKEKTRVIVLFNMFIRHWKEHVRETIKPLLEGYESRIETGDIEYASHCMSAYCLYMFLAGMPLVQVEKEQNAYRKSIILLKQKFDLDNISNFHQMTLNLMDPKRDLNDYSGTSFNVKEMVPVLIKEENKTALFAYYLFKMNLLYLCDNFDKAMINAMKGRQYIDSVRSIFVVPNFHFYESLIYLALCDSASNKERAAYLTQVKKNQNKMKKWATHAPMNHLHKWHIVEAEKMRVLKQNEDARTNFVKAMAHAKKNDYLQEEALACELYAKFLMQQGDIDFAGLMMRKAVYLYSLWGALSKVTHLEKTYQDFLKNDASESMGALWDTVPRTSTDKLTSSEALDMSTILKASRTMSREIVLSRLLEKIMRIIMENAGAQKGCVILEEKKHLYVEAEGEVGRDDIHILKSIPVETYENIPRSIINYVARTKKILILDDAYKNGEFTDDAYVVKNKTKSIVCSAIMNQGKLSAIVYMENNLSAGAFQQDRLELLTALASQAAISINNARLYENLEEKVKERTEELNITLKKVENANDHIMESIRYSRLIQNSLLPDPAVIKGILPKSFFVWEPRDIVGGDIYYYDALDSGIILAVIDCTGHGVPGAFMTMLASSGLQRIVGDERIVEPAHILKKLNYIIKTSLQQNTEHSKSDDGLDAAVCFFDYKTRDLLFAGARLPLYIMEKGEIKLIKGDRHSLGYVSSDLSYEFTTHKIPNQDLGKSFYMITDGYIDQLGGSPHMRFGSKRFKQLLVKHHTKDFDDQKNILLKELARHQADNPRTDDVTLAGFAFDPNHMTGP
ncbi:MAG: AAA family ATPase [Proteobacteria bacterium]|nr:AAA family ATPase [Pseudomonadota bacterium]